MKHEQHPRYRAEEELEHRSDRSRRPHGEQEQDVPRAKRHDARQARDRLPGAQEERRLAVARVAVAVAKVLENDSGEEEREQGCGERNVLRREPDVGTEQPCAYGTST